MRKRFIFEIRIMKEEDYYLKIKTVRNNGMIPYPVTFSELSLPLEVRASGKGHIAYFDFNNANYPTGDNFSDSYNSNEKQKNVLNKLEKSLNNNLSKMIREYENCKSKWKKIKVFEEAIQPSGVSIGGTTIRSANLKHPRGIGFKF